MLFRNADCSKYMVHSKFKAIDNIIIHDAARPFVTVENIDECIRTLDDHEGAMPVLPMKDTVYFSRTGKRVDELLNRSCIYAGQAPEAFRFDKYMEANEALLPDKSNAQELIILLESMDVIINDAPLHDDNIIYNSNGKMWCALGKSKNWHEVGLNMKIALQHNA